jgi:hypothetical protein
LGGDQLRRGVRGDEDEDLAKGMYGWFDIQVSIEDLPISSLRIGTAALGSILYFSYRTG